MIVHADRRPNVDHKSRMIIRRARQLDRKPGFTPVPNHKIEARITSMEALLTAGYKGQVDAGKMDAMPSAAKVRTEATRAIARTLPAVPLGVRTRPFQNRSKYNQENTRGNR